MTHASTIVKAGLAVLVASTATVTGFGIHSALQDKTIGDAIIRKGKTLINNKDVFEIAFKQHKKEQAFLTLISTEGNNIQASDSLEKGGLALNAGCTEKLKLELKEDNIKAFLNDSEKYCSLPGMTMREKLKGLGKKLASDGEKRLNKIDGGNEKGKNRELMSELLTFISGSSGYGYNLDTGKTALMNGCTTKADTSLTNDRDDSIFKKVDGGCLEQKTQQ